MPPGATWWKMRVAINGSRPPRSGLAGTLISALLFAAAPAAAQQPVDVAPSSADPPPATEKSKSDPKAPVISPNGTSNDRLFYALPNFLTMETSHQLPPMTSWQKFKGAAQSSFDYFNYPWYGALAGISQAENSEKGYGQGMVGYARRYGAAFADGTIENFMTGAILPSLLKEDPRFYQSYSGTFWRRTGYAVSRIFVTRTDSGHDRFNFSEIFGSAISAGISTYTYHPREDRNVGNALSVWGTQVGYDTLTIVMKEFWPDLRRKFSRKAQTETLAP